jgi:hypothetical protein
MFCPIVGTIDPGSSRIDDGREESRMARGWGERLSIGLVVFLVATVVFFVPAVWLAARISCWGVDTTYPSPGRYCGFGALYGVVIAPALGLFCGIAYTIVDFLDSSGEQWPSNEWPLLSDGRSPTSRGDMHLKQVQDLTKGDVVIDGRGNEVAVTSAPELVDGEVVVGVQTSTGRGVRTCPEDCLHHTIEIIRSDHP